MLAYYSARGAAAFAPLVLILLGLFVLAAVAMIGYVIYYYVFRGLLAPTRREMARLLWKVQRETELDAPDAWGPWTFMSTGVRRVFSRGRLCGGDGITLYHSWDYFLTFQFMDGRQQEFSVSQDTYASVSEMDEGLLVYKGNLFRHFIPRVKDEPEPPRFTPRSA